MTKKAKDLITSVTQMWVAYGACKNESRAEEIKKDAGRSTDALIAYIDALETSTPTPKKTMAIMRWLYNSVPTDSMGAMENPAAHAAAVAKLRRISEGE